MRLNNPKILNTIDAIIGDNQIPEQALYALRYQFPDCKISRKELKKAATDLSGFLNSFPSARNYVSSHFFPVIGDQISLHDDVIFITHLSNDHYSVRVYSPSHSFENPTVHLKNTHALPHLKEELIFLQDGDFVEYDKVNHNKEIIAISKGTLLGTKSHIVLHYAP